MGAARWQARHYGRVVGHATSMGAAMNLCDRAPPSRTYLTGHCEVEQLGTGELWERRKGQWNPVRERREVARVNSA